MRLFARIDGDRLVAKIEQLVVVVDPMLHLAAAHVIGDVIDRNETGARNMRMSFGKRNKIDIEDRHLAITVDQINGGFADSHNGGNVEFHHPCPSRFLDDDIVGCPPVRSTGVFDTNGDGIDRCCSNIQERTGETWQVRVDQQIDLALPIKRDVLGTVPGDGAESRAAQEAGEWHRIGCRELDELEAVRAHRILLLSQIDDRRE